MDCTPDVVELVATYECFAPHFHLPLQHASDRVLHEMRRPYDIEYFDALVVSIRERIPNAAIGSDVIVGFPGETQQDFERLLSYLDNSPLTHLHVFPYSDRPGTPAAQMANKVPGPEVRERARRVREISERLSDRFRQSQIGTIHRGLTLGDGSLAVTGNYLKVKIPAGHSRNEWVRVKIDSVAGTATGSVISIWPGALRSTIERRHRELLSGRAPRALDDELPAGSANVSAPALSDRDREVMVRKDSRETIDRLV
jgi:threonylcarbamoyladenosine tRNA methylthiotransferase MtaB